MAEAETLVVGKLDDNALVYRAATTCLCVFSELLSKGTCSSVNPLKITSLREQPYVNFILTHTPNYLQQKRPASYPSSLPWPDKYTIVDGLAEMARLKWPLVLNPPTSLIRRRSALISLLTGPSSPQYYSLLPPRRSLQP